jgi:hypothetical protein
MSINLKPSYYTITDLYAQYWQCRDFELKNLWQRSIFLTAFMLIFFTGYGAFALKIFISNEGEMKDLLDPDLFFPHTISLFIAFGGLLISILWILMAKASKAWYEVYETAIGAIDRGVFNNADFMPFQDIGAFKVENNQLYRQKNSERKFDQAIFSCNGGLFSPSKINIAIGQLLFSIWIFIFSFHLSFFLQYFDLSPSFLTHKIIIEIIIVTVSLLYILYLLSPFKIKNKPLRVVIAFRNRRPSFKRIRQEICLRSIFSKWLGSSVLYDKDPGYKTKK